MLSKRDRWLLIVLAGIALIALAYAAGHAQLIRPKQWMGITDNQGNTATVTGGQLVVTVVPPTPTPTP